jgi:hypothetical protein
MARFGKRLLAFIVAAMVTYLIASASATAGVLGNLSEMGFVVSFGDRIATTLADIAGLLPLFLPLLAIALLLGFLVTGLIARWQPSWRSFGYPLAGFAAVIVLHLTLKAVLGVTPIVATREVGGLLMQGIAGAAGGYAFYYLTGRLDQRS